RRRTRTGRRAGCSTTTRTAGHPTRTSRRPARAAVRLIAVRNVVKAWLLLAGVCGVLAFIGWSIGGLRLLSIFVFSGLLLVIGACWAFDPVVLAASMIELSRIGGWLERALLFVLGPIAAACVHVLLSPKREFEADRRAAELCGSPHGLADALLRLEQAAELIDFKASPATEPL